MPSLLRKAGKLMRRGGKLARAGCRAACCDNVPRFVKVVDCCFPTEGPTRWLNVAAHCPNTGAPVWTLGGPPVRFDDGTRTDGSHACSVTIPTIVMTYADIVAADPNAVFVFAQDCIDGGCNSAPCTCPACCTSGIIHPCGPRGPGAGTCCECGSHFTLFFQVDMDYNVYEQAWAAIVGGGGDPCTGVDTGAPPFCYDTVSGPYLKQSIRTGLTLAIEYVCDAAGNLTPICRQYGYSRVEQNPTYHYPQWYIDYLGGFLTCVPDQDGWLPEVLDPHEVRCEESGCENNACGGRADFDPVGACSLDKESARNAARILGADFESRGVVPSDPGWSAIRESTCNGHLHADHDPYLTICNSPFPLPEWEWRWKDTIKCRQGEIEEHYRWTGVFYGGVFRSGTVNRRIFWTITRHQPCAVPPCPGVQPIFTPNSVFMVGQSVRAEDFI